MGGISQEVLVVEDDSNIAYLLDFMLSKEGYKVRLAKDGNEALLYIDDINFNPLFILLDIMVPYIDGYELLKRIRSKPSLSSIPVLMLSAKSQEADKQHARELKADDYILKPFQPVELLERIQRLLKSR